MDARFYKFQIYYKSGLEYIKAPIPVFDDHREACARAKAWADSWRAVL